MLRLKSLLIGAAALLVSACGTGGHATKVIDAGCYWAKPIFISSQDTLTEDTADQILIHNETGNKRCGWLPRERKTYNRKNHDP